MKSNRHLVLSKIKKLIKNNDFLEAEKLCSSINSSQYEDVVDLEINRLKNIVYNGCDEPILSNKYNNLYLQMKDRGFCEKDIESFLKTSSDSYSVLSEDNVERLIEWHIEHLRYVECGILIAYASKKGYALSKKVIQAIDKEKALNEFSNYLSCRAGLFSFEECESSAPQSLLTKVYKNALSEIGWSKQKFSEVGKTKDGQPWLLFSTREWLESNFKKNKKVLNMFYRHYEDINQLTHFYALFVGDYFSFLNAKYKYGISEDSFKKSSVDFTILLPVRNSIKYLAKTIQTCDQLKFDGKYEILISDNSTYKSDEILNIIKESGNPHLRYVKTPCDLPLARSFEFGYLSALGRYIISLGSDDGVMPRSLEYLQSAISRNHADIIMSPLASYFWESYPFSEKAKDLCFSSCDSYCERVLDMKKYRGGYAINQIYYLWLPMMYMTTCVSKGQILKIIAETGKFEMGVSQDVYTGIANAFINEDILYMNYPIVLAGNSEIGTGVNCSSKDDVEQRIKQYSSFNDSFETLNILSLDFSKIEKVLNFSTVFLCFAEFLKVEGLLEGSEKLKVNKSRLLEAYLSDPTNEFDRRESSLVVRRIKEALESRECSKESALGTTMLAVKKLAKKSRILRFVWNRTKRKAGNDNSYNPFLYEDESTNPKTDVIHNSKSDIIDAVRYADEHIYRNK